MPPPFRATRTDPSGARLEVALGGEQAGTVEESLFDDVGDMLHGMAPLELGAAVTARIATGSRCGSVPRSRSASTTKRR